MRKHAVALVMVVGMVLVPGTGLANGGPLAYLSQTDGNGVAGEAKLVGSDSVSLAEEDLHLEVNPYYTRGTVRYVLRNEGEAQEVKLGFTTLVHSPGSEPGEGPLKGEYHSYTVKVNDSPVEWEKKLGRRMPIMKTHSYFPWVIPASKKYYDSYIDEPGSKTYKQIAQELYSTWYWDYVDDTEKHSAFRYMHYVSKIPFEPGEEVVVDITFLAYNWVRWNVAELLSGDRVHVVGRSDFLYLLDPATKWHGKVGRMDISMRIDGYPIDGELDHLEPGIEPEPHEEVEGIYRWHFEDVEPEQNLAVRMRFSANFDHGSFTPRDVFFSKLMKKTIGKYGGALLDPSAVESVSASSEFGEYGSATNLLDLDPIGSAWISAKGPGKGKGESITVTLDEPATIHSVALLAGNQSKKAKYWRYSRPKVVEIVVNDERKQIVELEDGYVPYVIDENIQVLELEHPENVSTLTINILEVYEGSMYRRVSVSEILLFEEDPESLPGVSLPP